VRRAFDSKVRRHALALVAGWIVTVLPAHAAGNAARGAQAYEARCSGCHSVEFDRIGPRHAGLLGRRAGSIAGFEYSNALKGSNVVWNEQTLERWLADPEALVPGQRMGYSLADAAVRADVIAYLATLTALK
jgi:cytochrome c